MDYIIVPTSNSEYQSWQCRLLNWSRKKVKQSGKLVLLRCADPMGRNRPLDEYTDTDVVVIDLPDYATEWENLESESKRGEKYWWGAIPNKFMSIKWLCDNSSFKDEDNLLFLDPDMIFLHPVEFVPKYNEIIAQRFIHYAPLQNWKIENDRDGFGVMYPFCIKFGTLKKIIDDYITSSEQIKRETKRWESEMWGLDYAVKKNNLKIQYVEDFGFCTAWKENDSNEVSLIAHFPNEIFDANNNSLFFKQDYTHNQNMQIDVNRARNKLDELLLSNIAQERTDYLYHLKWNFSNIFNNYTGKTGYIILKPWPGGFNNIRMSLELAVCIAYLTNKTLVLPPKYNMYLLKDTFGLEDFFDMSDLGIKTMSFFDFCRLKNITPTFEAVAEISKTITEPEFHVLNFTESLPDQSFKHGRSVTDMIELLGHNECLFFDGKLLGNFYQTIYTTFDVELKKLIARHVHYTPKLMELGWRAIEVLGDRKYYAIHIRRNDFQYKHLFITAEQIYDNIKDIIPDGSTLYIATDHTDKSFFDKLAQHYQLHYYEDIAHLAKLENVHYNFIPIIEQLICTRSIKFIGNDYSTLSSYIYRLRGYMKDIEDKNFYINTSTFNQDEQCDSTETKRFIGNWAREFKDAWDFKPKKIFVSVASYCDRQLLTTLRNLYETAQDSSRIMVGVHLQDNEEYHKELLNENFPNMKILFTPDEDSLGVVWARERIKQELITDEDFFLQIDAHSRFKQNWDGILINQYRSMPNKKVVFSTYPNGFELTDTEKNFLSIKTNAPLVISGHMDVENVNPIDNRLVTKNLVAMDKYEIFDNKWIGAGFIFAPIEWTGDIQVPMQIKSKGEEEAQTFLSYLKGWDIKLPAEATVWHNYNIHDLDGTVYRKTNHNEITDKSVEIINDILFNTSNSYSRSLEELEDYLSIKFRRI